MNSSEGDEKWLESDMFIINKPEKLILMTQQKDLP